MFRLFVILGLLAGLAPAGCQSSHGVFAEHEQPHDYRLVFKSGTFVKQRAAFHGILTLEGGREIWVSLEANNGELAAAAATRWTDQLNARQPGLAESSSNTILLRRIQGIELRGPLRGVRLKEIGVSP